MKCIECKHNFPDYLVSTLHLGDSQKLVCPICALKLTNKFHGTNRTKFHGRLAETYRLAAIKWLKEKR